VEPVLLLGDDVVAVERRKDIRVIVRLTGRYMLANRRDLRGNRREFACRAVNVSPQAITLAVPVIGKIGERVIAHIDGLGKLQGGVMHALTGGFVMNIVASDEERAKLTDRIEWLERNKMDNLSDQRTHERFLPRNPFSRLLLADGSVLSCLVIDLSSTGAAVSADVVLPVGAVVALGSLVGRVVRVFGEGFAVTFTTPQQRERVEDLVCQA
jgi:hypothetical protein